MIVARFVVCIEYDTWVRSPSPRAVAHSHTQGTRRRRTPHKLYSTRSLLRSPAHTHDTHAHVVLATPHSPPLCSLASLVAAPPRPPPHALQIMHPATPPPLSHCYAQIMRRGSSHCTHTHSTNHPQLVQPASTSSSLAPPPLLLLCRIDDRRLLLHLDLLKHRHILDNSRRRRRRSDNLLRLWWHRRRQ